MTQKTSRAPRPLPPTSGKALARRASTLSKRLLKFLGDTPALTAASVLSNMLQDTSDPATRLAILETRILVLRARTVACREGNPADGAITLGAMLEKQNRPEKPVSSAQPPAPPEHVEGEAETPPSSPAEQEPMLQMQLLKAYNHQGIDLPEGAVFTISKSVADDLLERGISKLVAADTEQEKGTGPNAADAADTETKTTKRKRPAKSKADT